MLILVLSLENTSFMKERIINASRGTSEAWFPVGFASWLNS